MLFSRFLKFRLACICLIVTFCTTRAVAQTDTLRLLAYNILYMGDNPPCQGSHSIYEGYLGTVVNYVNPDIVGFVKRESEDIYGTANPGFADSILQNVFEPYYPGVFAYCPYTNYAGADNITTLYYNQNKLGSAGLFCTYSNITDFDTYKLYYKSSTLATLHDTIFLYVTLNHDNSGSSSSDATTRSEQIGGEMAQIETYFSHLPNMVNMGDFNTHNSSEGCYQTLVAPADTGFAYFDPPFYPDAVFTYPADWDNNPSFYSSALTVSTRTNSTAPNSCSTNYGGGKSWYDHIFLSSNIINNVDRISYSPHTFRVVGNDGNRLGNPANSSPVNTSVPAPVINSIFELSEHYPITADLLVHATPAATNTIYKPTQKITVVNPVQSQITIHLPIGLSEKSTNVTCTDMLGRVVMQSTVAAVQNVIELPCDLLPGIYCLRIEVAGQPAAYLKIQKA